VALGALHVVVAGDSSPGMSAAARVHRLAQNVERAESVRAVKRVKDIVRSSTQPRGPASARSGIVTEGMRKAGGASTGN